MLAVLDNNNNIGRQQATIKTGPHKGEVRYYTVCPKGRKGWVAKPIYEDKNYDYVFNLIAATRDLCASGKEAALKMPVRELPPNIAREEKPAKEEVVEVHRSRFEEKEWTLDLLFN